MDPKCLQKFKRKYLFDPFVCFLILELENLKKNTKKIVSLDTITHRHQTNIIIKS